MTRFRGRYAVFRQCQFCAVSLSVRLVDIHEANCEANPVAASRKHIKGPRFNSLGKQFVKKLPAPGALGETGLRIATYWDHIEQKSKPILQDDAIHLHELGVLRRDGKQLNFFRFRQVNLLIPLDPYWERDLDRVEKALQRAWQMGARL